MLQGRVASTHRAEHIEPPARADLSRRQHEVLALLADGVAAREIAVRLDLAEATVRNHIRLVLRKLGRHSQLEAVAVAFRLGMIRSEPPLRNADPRHAEDRAGETTP